MQEPNSSPTSRSIRLRLETQRLAALARKVTPVIIGVLITLVALFLFSIINPAARPLTQKELDQHIAQVMASATPPPALSARVYAAVQPSVVQIETKIVTTEGKEEGGRGAGVIIDDNAQILTSLHV